MMNDGAEQAPRPHRPALRQMQIGIPALMREDLDQLVAANEEDGDAAKPTSTAISSRNIWCQIASGFSNGRSTVPPTS